MTQIELTFLGTTAGVPTKFRNHPAIFLRYQSQNEWCCLFDCGEGTQRQAMSCPWVNFMRIDRIFITHWHADHFAGLLGLFETMDLEQRKDPLYVYGPEAERFVHMIANIGYHSKDFPIRAVNVEYEGTAIETIFEDDEFVIQAIPMKHGIPAVAYAFVEKDRIKVDKKKAKKMGLPEKGPIYHKIKDTGSAEFNGEIIKFSDIQTIEKGKRVVYTGDTLPNKNIIKIAKDADLLIHDTTFFEEEKKQEIGCRHPTLEGVKSTADESNVKKVILTHISRRYQNIKELEDMIADRPNFKLARDFMKVVVE
ncbi:MAG: ribonuclease Z [Candidatus Aenigmatarchaeota archaeon]